MKDFTNSKILGKSNCQGHNQSWMRKVKCIKLVMRFTFLWKENRSCYSKHQGHYKTKFLMFGVDAKTFYFKKK